MIGDWVLYEGSPNMISEISEEIVGEATVCFVGNRYMANIYEVNPIPITTKILEKNGFEYKEADETCATEAFHHWYLVGSRFAIDDDSWWRSVKDGELHVKFGGFPLKYLHELQHALRLAGIDKKITL